MGDGLKRARTAARATRKGKCPACGKTVKLLLVTGRVPLHGPKDAHCSGSGEFPPKGS
jgi:hypothetical protein